MIFNNNTPTLLSSKPLNAARFAVFSLVLGIFFSTALMSLSEVIILLMCITLAIGGGSLREQLKLSFRFPMVKAGLALLLLIFLYGFISEASVSSAMKHFIKYRELFLLPLLIFVLNDIHWKKIIYTSFLVGMVLVLTHSYLQFFDLVPNSTSLDEQNTSTVGRIAGAIMLAFTCFAFLEEALRNKRTYQFWLWFSLFLLASFALLYFYNGRTGILIYFVLLILWGFRFLGIKGVLVTALLVCGLFFSLYHTSPTVKNRIDATNQQIHSLVSSNIAPDDPTRVGIYSSTQNLIQKHSMKRALIGGGTGSLEYESTQNGYNFKNPHNEYVLIYFENGIAGLILLILFLTLVWRQAAQLDEHEKWLLRALVVTFSVGSLLNSLLLDNREAHFFILLIATLLPVYSQQDS